MYDINAAPSVGALEILADGEHVLVLCGRLASAEVEHCLERLLLEVNGGAS